MRSACTSCVRSTCGPAIDVSGLHRTTRQPWIWSGPGINGIDGLLRSVRTPLLLQPSPRRLLLLPPHLFDLLLGRRLDPANGRLGVDAADHLGAGVLLNHLSVAPHRAQAPVFSSQRFASHRGRVTLVQYACANTCSASLSTKSSIDELVDPGDLMPVGLGARLAFLRSP